MIRNTIGALSNHILISHGGLVVSYLVFGSIGKCIRSGQKLTHIDDLLHVIPSRLLTPDETLNTSDMNQKKFTMSHRLDWMGAEIVIWRVVAVTLEKNVAIVVMLTYRVVALSFSSIRNIGRAMNHTMLQLLNIKCNVKYLFRQNCAIRLSPQSLKIGN